MWVEGLGRRKILGRMRGAIMATEVKTVYVSILRCAGMLGVSYHYLQAIIKNTPEITTRRIGGCNAVNFHQVRRILKAKGVKFGEPYHTSKSELRIVRKPAVNE
jgi:hypothetical protein